MDRHLRRFLANHEKRIFDNPDKKLLFSLIKAKTKMRATLPVLYDESGNKYVNDNRKAEALAKTSGQQDKAYLEKEVILKETRFNKRAQNELCSHQKKIYEIDTHAGVSIAGLLSDGRILARFLQTECSSWRWDYKLPVPISSLADSVQLKLQANTQYYGRRPFGVGLLIAGYDKDGTHIVQSDPSAEVVEMFASSIGARSQSARTYLERHLDKFRTASADELIRHALLALRDTLPAEENLTNQTIASQALDTVKIRKQKNTSIAIVGKDQPFKIMDDSEVAPHLAKISSTPRTTAQSDTVIGMFNKSLICEVLYEDFKNVSQRSASRDHLVLSTDGMVDQWNGKKKYSLMNSRFVD
ncbi:multicatalytic endopeptidase domain protein [Teladorsagia circumcincta]|uniref:Multicatalytic endopeptidase domain protein n=1 Tax=Teladorsagia circumcincta TaxID=45464 RepID=A0A2G9UWP5_TELCI|nr:multicatalytic endopeptidase domain protein [Teladorsagia circumcincta]